MSQSMSLDLKTTPQQEKKIVYLTGSTGGIGRAISQVLESSGRYTIVPITSRLENSQALQSEITGLIKHTPPFALIHAAGFGQFKPHEEIAPKTIEKMVQVNLTAPMLLANLCIRSLRIQQGHIIHIASVEATRSARWSALYSATKTGLRAFSHCLYEELRKSGVRVTCINPDLTRTGFFDSLDFQPAVEADAALDPLELAQTVQLILESRGVISDVTLRPRKLGIEKKRV